MKSKNKIALFNIASTVILQGLAFFSGPLFSSTLGTNNYGVASVYLTWVQIALTVFSLQAAGTIALARVNFPMEDQSKYQSSVLFLATISYLGFSVITIIVAWTASRFFAIRMEMVLVGLVHGWGWYCVIFMNQKFTYEFKADRNFVLSTITAFFTIGLSLFLISRFPQDINYWGRILGQTITYAVIGMGLFIAVIRKGKTLYNKEYWKFTLPIAIPTIFHLLAGILLNQSDRVMLQGLISNSAAGIYALACTFAMVLNTLWNALNNSWVPFYYEYTRLNQIKEMRKHAYNYTELFTVLTIGFILLTREVFHIYAKAGFWDGTDIIPILSLGYYFVFLYSFPVNYEFYHKKTRTIAVGTCSAALCNIILNYFFIKMWGIQGAVIATALSHGLQFLFHYFSAKKIDPDDFPFRLKDFLPGLFMVLAAIVFYWYTREYWVIRWMTGVLLGGYIAVKIIRRKEIF